MRGRRGEKGRSPVFLRSSDLVRQLPSPYAEQWGSSSTSHRAPRAHGGAEAGCRLCSQPPRSVPLDGSSTACESVPRRFTGGHFPLLHGRVLLCLAFRHPESRVPAPSHPHPPRFPATVPAEQPHPREACFSSLRETRRNRAQESGDKLEGGPGGILSCPCQAAPDRCAQRLVEAQSCSSETPRSPHMASRGVPRSLRARGWCGLGSRDGKTEGVLGRPPVTGTGPSWEACGICLRNAIGV